MSADLQEMINPLSASYPTPIDLESGTREQRTRAWLHKLTGKKIVPLGTAVTADMAAITYFFYTLIIIFIIVIAARHANRAKPQTHFAEDSLPDYARVIRIGDIEFFDYDENRYVWCISTEARGIGPSFILSLSFVAEVHALIWCRRIDLLLSWMNGIKWKSFRFDRPCPYV